jgi:hypothetical protein
VGEEQIKQPSEWQELAQENGSLRAIIAELLLTNQTLRWELLAHRHGHTQDPKLLSTSEGTPLRNNSRTLGVL